MPPAGQKAERFEMRIDPELLERLDNWRAAEDDGPSRAEAIRRLVEAGLAHDNKGRPPTLSDGEKLITVMLADVMKALKVNGETNVDLVTKVIYGGHYWALPWEMQGVFHGHADKQSRVRFVVDVLDMYRFLQDAMDAFTANQKDEVASVAEPFGKDVTFPGFDGNYEGEYLSIARFLTEDLRRFTSLRLAADDLNSHFNTLDGYRRMLAVFLPLRGALTGRTLTPGQVVAMLNARRHPDRQPVAG